MNRKAGIILSSTLMAFEVFSTLLLTPFIIRTLGQAEYGVYKLVSAVNAYLLLLDLGIGTAVTRYIAKYRTTGDRENERRFLGVSTIFYGSVAALAVILGAVLVLLFPTVFAKGLTEGETLLGQKLLFISMLNSAAALGTAASSNTIIAYERFYVSRGASIVQIILRMALTYAALKLGFGSMGIVTINLALTILCRAFFVLYVRFGIGLRAVFRGTSRDFIRGVVVYSSLIFVQMVATQLNFSVDQVLIGSLVASSSTILAVYGVGTQIVQYFRSIGSAFTDVLMPGIVRMVESGSDSERILSEMVRVGRIIFMCLLFIWVVFAVNGAEFISLWAGEENSRAYIVAVLLMPVMQIRGSSMETTLYDGDLVLSLNNGKYHSGDVIGFYYNNGILIKRVIASSGEWVNIDEEGTVYVNGVRLEEPYVSEKALGECNISLPYQVPEGKCFVMGDHRATSMDSRNSSIGCISNNEVVGKLILRIWPLRSFGGIA